MHQFPETTLVVVTETMQKRKSGIPAVYSLVSRNDRRKPSWSFVAIGCFSIKAAVCRIKGLPDCFSVSTWKWWNFA